MSIQKRAKLVPWIAAFAVAVLVAILAVPSLAAPGGAKNFSISASPTSVAAGTNAQLFSVKVTNTSPAGSSSNISSVSILVPSQFTVINTTPNKPAIDPANSSNPSSGATVTIGSGNPSCNMGGSQNVNVCNLDPTKRLQFVTVKIWVNVAASGWSCGNNPVSWSATPNTGSSLNGDNFTESSPVPAGKVTQVVSTAGCKLVFTTGPSDGLVNTNDPTTVHLVTGPNNAAVASAPSTWTVSIVTESAPTGGALINTGPVAISCANGSCSASFPTLQGNQQGSYTVHAHSAQIGNAADSDPASFILYKSLACGATDTSVDPAVQITNTNSGTNCPPTVYAASFGDNQFDLTKPNGEQITGLQVQVGAWDPEEAHNPVPPTQVSGPNPADGLHDGQWCNGTPAHPTMPGGEIWCLVSQSTMLAGTDTDGSITGTAGTQLMQVTEIWLLEGDAALCRTCGK